MGWLSIYTSQHPACSSAVTLVLMCTLKKQLHMINVIQKVLNLLDNIHLSIPVSYVSDVNAIGHQQQLMMSYC